MASQSESHVDSAGGTPVAVDMKVVVAAEPKVAGRVWDVQR
jgi:hypothetical protein